MNCGIYGIRNIINGKWYVGQSIDLQARKHWHFAILKRGIHCNQHLQSSFIKYGVDGFEFRILEETEEGLLDIQERLWITHYKSNQSEFGYNLMTGGKALKRHSKESILKMSLVKMGVKFSEEHCRKIGEANSRRILSKETRRKISVAHKGKSSRWGCRHSVETRNEMSRARKGIPWSEKRRENYSNKQHKEESV
jgi:group I intron endonuclease